MGFRFRRRLTIIPGVRLNLSRSGTSVSIGGHGATVNYSKRGKRATLGLPGSGLSYSTYQRHDDPGGQPLAPLRTAPLGRNGIMVAFFALVVLVAVVFMVSAAVGPVRSAAPQTTAEGQFKAP